MNLGFEIHPTGPGLACAAVAVAAGAPLFSDGLRALRLRRGLATLEPVRVDRTVTGLVHLFGRVALESPLFAPLSGRPCAGFRLEVRAVGLPTLGATEERRRFTLVDGDKTARVLEQRGRWELSATAERDVAPGESLSDYLIALVHRIPEMTWARSSGATLHLVERALLAGTDCHVIGLARRGRAQEVEAELELTRTGTDDVAWPSTTASQVAASHGREVEPDLWVGSGDHLDFLYVTDRKPDQRHLGLPAWRVVGTVVGPALSLAGLSYLAGALDSLRAMGNP